MGSYAWYYIFPILIAILATFGYKNKKVGYLIFFLLFFFNIFRGDGVGNDTANYMDWSKIQYKGGNLEIGFTGLEDLGSKYEIFDILINRLVYSFGLNPRWVITIYSLITYLFLGLAFKRFKVNISLACLFYLGFGFYFNSMNTARQLAGISVALYAYSFLFSDKKKLMFCFWTIVSSMIHMTLIFILPVYFLRYLKVNKKLAAFICGIVSLFFVVTQINPLTIFDSYFQISYVSNYLGVYSDENGRNLIGMMFSIVTLFLMLLFYWKRNKNEKTDLSDNIFLVSLVLINVFAASAIVDRIVWNYSIFLCIYFADYFVKNQPLMKKNAVTYFIFLFLMLYGMSKSAYGGSLINGYYLNFF